jgi:hypothetical protein
VHPDIVLNGNSINNENGINNGNVKGKINLNIGRSVSSINLSKNKRASFSH